MDEKMNLLTRDTFSSHVTDTDGVILFFKMRCPNCKVMKKVLSKCMVQSPDLNIAGVDVESEPRLMKHQDISKIPTIMVHKNGSVKVCKSGLMKPADLLSLYDEC